MNVLLTSAGGEPPIVREWVRATHERGGRLVVGDSDGLAPAYPLADHVVRLPPPRDREYLPRLLAAVAEHDVQLVVPFGDAELPLLAEAHDDLRLRGCRAVVSTPEFVALADDKLATVRFCNAHDIDAPPTWSAADAHEVATAAALFIRPRHGHGSIGARPATRSNLADLVAPTDDVVVQPFVRAPEITVDALLDLDGHLLHWVPRLRLVVEAGRSTRAVTIGDERVNQWAEHVLTVLGASGARGPICVQAFFFRRRLLLIEVNARSAHGVALTYAAGGDHPTWVLQMVAGEPSAAVKGTYVRGLHMATYAEPVITDAPRWT